MPYPGRMSIRELAIGTHAVANACLGTVQSRHGRRIALVTASSSRLVASARLVCDRISAPALQRRRCRALTRASKTDLARRLRGACHRRRQPAAQPRALSRARSRGPLHRGDARRAWATTPAPRSTVARQARPQHRSRDRSPTAHRHAPVRHRRPLRQPRRLPGANDNGTGVAADARAGAPAA